MVEGGDGNLFNPGDVRQEYGNGFAGTSSASAIVAGAVLSLQGVRRAAGLPLYTGPQIRDVLAATGQPQYPEPERVGPLPDLRRAAPIAMYCGNGVIDAAERCDDGNADSGDGCDADCRESFCGNAIAAGDAECDDGNLVNDDGCDITCLRSRCGGDCNGDGGGRIDELVTTVRVALGQADLASCAIADLDADRRVSIDELVHAVSRALDGCR